MQVRDAVAWTRMGAVERGEGGDLRMQRWS